MNQLLFTNIKNLKKALLSLPPTGEKGFEGLIGVILKEISGVPFRLAGGGSQYGVDGKPAYEGDTICFEGKRYDGSVAKNELFSKIAELSINDTEIDMWVLGSTSQIRSQLADDLRQLGNKNGIFILILDWSETDLPPFAVALAMGGLRVKEFLKSNISKKKILQKALETLDVVRNSTEYSLHAERIRSQCNEPALGISLALRANIKWLSDAFSSRIQAKIKLGQALSPRDSKTVNVRQRKILTGKLHSYLTANTNETIVFILGGEGTGKSWIVAQSWLTLENKPLMVFMSPDDFSKTARQNDVIDPLIYKLIEQTGDINSKTNYERWSRMLRKWKKHPAMDSPRLIVVIDGINQRPKFDWGWIIENMGYELKKLSGCLVVTARTQYFQRHTKGRLSSSFIKIDIPEWTENERDEILAEHRIKVSELQHAVATSLCNPRLLGIVLELLDKNDITNFEELSVNRLLFEHIRMSERDAPIPQPAYKFARRLQKHAQEIISRVKAKQQDDLNIFEDEVGAVADGRFFQAVNGDPTRYSLKDDGLTLALGFSVIDKLRIAKRNNRNLDDEIYRLLEPIAALDDMANVILAALTVIEVEEPYEQDIAASLVKGFAVLQNLDQTKFFEFAGLAKRHPYVFMVAAAALSLAGAHQPNFDWIQDALIIAGKNSSSWQKMAEKVHLWLSAYSLSPELGIFSHPAHNPQKGVQEKCEKNKKRIEEKLQALSMNERAILKNMSEEKGNLNRLLRLALFLLAGKSLAPFAKSFMNWSFSFALNSDYNAPYKDFMHLVCLNRIDWLQTRSALLEASVVLRKSDVSATGKWTLVNILRATGHSGDAKEARALVEKLNTNKPLFESWRLIEKYCATDPCDPLSEEPENIRRTADRYSEIDVSKLSQHIGRTSEDHFFIMARPGVARFKPKFAIEKHREFVMDVLSREGFPLRQGLLELRNHNALLTKKEAKLFAKKGMKYRTLTCKSSLSEQDAWIISQYCLLMAFPFLTAWEQAKILLSNKKDQDILLDLLYLAKPLGENEFETLLKRSCREGNKYKQYLLLTLAKYHFVQISKDTRKKIATLFHSESKIVHVQALSTIAKSDNEELLRLVVNSGWKANNIEIENDFEEWYGSLALLKAASKGLIVHSEVLERISTQLYGRAVLVLERDIVREIARRINASINKVIDLDDDFIVPDIEIQLHPSNFSEPSRFNVNERLSKTNNLKEKIMRLSENNKAFEQRQIHCNDVFLEFKANLTKLKARIVIDYLSLEEFENLIAKAEGFADRWYNLFMNINESKLSSVYNLVLLLAHALGGKEPKKAEELFCRLKTSKPLVKFSFSRAGVQLDSMATWAGIRNPILDKLRFTRLNRASTDHDLFLEVLAAQLNGQQELLTKYIKEKLCKEEPAEISRGLMVAGFSNQSEFNDVILKKYESSAGLIKSAQKAAKHAYERNIWAQHWFEEMCKTNNNAEFWRYSILFLKIVDGRFEIRHSKYEEKGKSIQAFELSLNNRLKNRFEKWKNYRNKMLFGLDAPAQIFLT